MGENKLTVLDVEEGDEHSEQSRHGNLTHQLPVAMVGTECECAFAQVSQTLQRQTRQKVNNYSNTHTQGVHVHTNTHTLTHSHTFPKVNLCLVQGSFCFATHLSQSDHEEIIGIFGVILCQLPQHGCQSGIICA